MIELQVLCDFGFVLSGSDDFFEVDVGFEAERLTCRRRAWRRSPSLFF